MIDFENPNPDLSTNILYDIRLENEIRLGNYTNSYYTLRYRLNRTVHLGVMGDTLYVLEAGFQEFLRVLANRLDVRPNTKIGMVLYAERENYDTEAVIGISERLFSGFTVQHIMDSIMHALNSSQNFKFDFQIKLNMIRQSNIQGDEGMLSHEAYTAFSEKSRGIHRIETEADCVWIWFGLNIAFYRVRESGFRLPMSWSKEYCKRVWKNPKRFYTVLVTELQATWNTEYNAEVTLDYIQALSILWNIRIQLFRWNIRPEKHNLDVLQLTLDTEVRSPFTFYGILTETTTGLHLDFLQHPNKLWTGIIFCEVCKAFQKKKTLCKTKGCGTQYLCVYCHCCEEKCSSCNESECLHSSVLENPIKCHQCLQLLLTEGCVQNHEACQVQLRMCKKCHLLYHGSRPCYSKKCVGCWRYIDSTELETHKCFIQPIELQDPKEDFMVYDFECALDENLRHIPYLVTVWFPNGYEGLETLKAKFSFALEPFTQLEVEDVFVFWGLPEMPSPNVLTFFDLVQALEDVDCFAHNSKSYDGIFIKSNLMERGIVTEDIKRGAKYLQISIPKQSVHFKDSVSFMPCSLRSLSSDFGIEELAKGHFPHALMTTTFVKSLAGLHHIIPKPALDTFDFDFGLSKKALVFRNEAITWYHQWIQEDTEAWDIRKSCIEYCISDTVLLGLSLQKFRLEFLKLTEAIERPSYIKKHRALDPLRYVTLPSAIMKFYLSQCLPKNSIGILDRTDSEIYANVAEYEVYLQSMYESVGKVELPEGDFLKDLVFTKEARYWIFVPCYMTGCGKCFQLLEIQVRLEVSFQTLQKITEHNLRRFSTAQIMKECEWLQLRKSESVSEILYVNRLRLQKKKPMRFRDAYKGGFVETYTAAYYGELSYVDFVSQYPAAMMGETLDPLDPPKTLSWKLPVGTPTHLKHPTFATLKREYETGIAKVSILPPQNLSFPFLSMKIYVKKVGEEGTFEILYGLCRTCMEKRIRKCSHTVEERYLIGTWTMSELVYAEQLGYQVLEVFESLTYAESSTTLFRNFLTPILTQKILSKKSGLVVNGTLTTKGMETVAYLEQLNEKPFVVEDFYDSPAMRTICKLAMNAITGKWGQRDLFSSTKTFSGQKLSELDRMLQRHNVIVNDFTIFSTSTQGAFINVNYTPIIGSTPSYTVKNDLIVAEITANGRRMLHRIKMALGNRVLYSDTDSVVFRRGTLPFETGFKIGDLELEVEVAFDWISICRKSYIYFEDEKREDAVIKQKGVTLGWNSKDKISFSELQKLLRDSITYAQSGVEYPTKKAAQDAKPSIAIPQRLFKTNFENPDSPYKQTVMIDKNIHFEVLHFKRMLCLDRESLEINSKPFGYL